jgi:shikimate 5-dehydrogenase
MLLHQGVLAFQYWTGLTPPADVMRAALEAAISARGD